MRHLSFVLAAITASTILLASCTSSGDPGAADPTTSGEPGGPGLAVGDAAPDATVHTQAGEAVSLAGLYPSGPTVVTFYRGGWCPYCNRAMSAWQGKLDELADAGGRLVALTPESPGHASETIDKNGMGFDVYSDNSMEAARAFKVFFEVDPDTQSKYRGYGIDLAAWNATGEWTLPAPGTFVVDRDGVIRYAWADWDYKNRADPDEVIAAVRAAR